MAARAETTIVAFSPAHKDNNALPKGSLKLHADGKYTAKLRVHNKRHSIAVVNGKPFDAERVRKWLEACEFARICSTYLSGVSDGAMRYQFTQLENFNVHLNVLRSRAEQLLAAPQDVVGGTLAIRRQVHGARILDTPPGPDLVTSLVLESGMYRHIFYTPASRTVQQGAMTPQFVIPEEVHNDTEQYFLVKAGHGWSVVDGQVSELHTTSAFWVYRGQRHAIVSDPGDSLRLFIAYSPAHHSAGRVNQNNVDVLEAK